LEDGEREPSAAEVGDDQGRLHVYASEQKDVLWVFALSLDRNVLRLGTQLIETVHIRMANCGFHRLEGSERII
jgi:hypothetical protein